jgi:hypothetical protein
MFGSAQNDASFNVEASYILLLADAMYYYTNCGKTVLMKDFTVGGLLFFSRTIATIFYVELLDIGKRPTKSSKRKRPYDCCTAVFPYCVWPLFAHNADKRGGLIAKLVV